MADNESAADRRERFRREVAEEFGLDDDQAARLEGSTKQELAGSAAQIIAEDPDGNGGDTGPEESEEQEDATPRGETFRRHTVKDAETGNLTEVFRV